MSEVTMRMDIGVSPKNGPWKPRVALGQALIELGQDIIHNRIKTEGLVMLSLDAYAYEGYVNMDIEGLADAADDA